ncbi:hypothetical protein Hanom_Chr15g01382571 [Helianthus anomalus]
MLKAQNAHIDRYKKNIKVGKRQRKLFTNLALKQEKMAMKAVLFTMKIKRTVFFVHILYFVMLAYEAMF